MIMDNNIELTLVPKELDAQGYKANRWLYESFSIPSGTHTIQWKLTQVNRSYTQGAFLDDVQTDIYSTGFEDTTQSVEEMYGFEEASDIILINEDFEDIITVGNLEWHEGFEFNDSADAWLYSIPISIEKLYELTEFSSNFSRPDIGTYITYYVLDSDYKEIINFESGTVSPKVKDITSISIAENPIVLKAHLVTEKAGETPAVKDWRVDYKTDPNPPDTLTIELQTKHYPYTGSVLINPTEIYKSDEITIESTSGDESGIADHKIQCKIEQTDGTWANFSDFPKIWSNGGLHSTSIGSFNLQGGNIIRFWTEATDTQGNYLASNVATFTILNHVPEAIMSCDIETCNGPGCECGPLFANNWTTYNGDGVLFHINNHSSELDGPTDVLTSIWSIIGYQDPFLTWSSGCGMIEPGTTCSEANMTMPKLTAGNYTIKLEVKDLDDDSHSITHPITVKQDIAVGFECSLVDPSDPLADPALDWHACEDIEPNTSDTVYLSDNQPSPHEHSLHSVDATSIIFRKWNKDETEFSAGNLNNSLVEIVMENNTHDVSLTVRDDIGRESSETHTITTGRFIPKYKEISPYTNLKEINISNVSSLFKKMLKLNN